VSRLAWLKFGEWPIEFKRFGTICILNGRVFNGPASQKVIDWVPGTTLKEPLWIAFLVGGVILYIPSLVGVWFIDEDYLSRRQKAEVR
jgi:hypothetical protein